VKADWHFSGVTIEITSLCNLDCKHCLLPRWYRRRAKYLPAQKVIDVVDTIWRMGGFYLAITGGEPTLYPHDRLVRIIREARSRGMFVMLNTNATNMSESLAEEIAALGVQVKVSLYGSDERSYVLFTGRKLYRKVDSSLRLLREKGAWVDIDVIYTSFHKNMGISLTKMLEYAHRFTEDVRVMGRILGGWRGREHVRELSLNEEDIVMNQEERAIFSYHPFIRFMPEPWDPCAVTYIPEPYITSDGWVLVCPFDDEVISSIYNPDWPSIYQEKVVSFRRLPWPGGRCNYKKLL